MEPRPLTVGWRTLIGGFRLPVFSTLTRNKRWHPEAALKAHGYACNHLNTQLHGKRWKKRGEIGVQGVAAIERHKSWNPHLHALLGHRDIDLALPEFKPLLREMQDFCDAEWGFSRWEVVTAEADCRNYVIDYAAKTGELYVSDNLEDLPYGNERLQLQSLRLH